MAQQTADNTEYRDEIESWSGTIGTLYREATLPDGRTIRRGDISAWDDPDIDERDWDRGVHSRAFLGYVKGIVKMDDDGSPALLTTDAAGRIDPADAEVLSLTAEDGPTPSDASGLGKFCQQLLQRREDGVNGLTMVWGEDIEDSGDDHRHLWQQGQIPQRFDVHHAGGPHTSTIRVNGEDLMKIDRSLGEVRVYEDGDLRDTFQL